MTDSTQERSLIEFPKIQSFSNLVSNIRQKYKDELLLPTIKYTGKIKAHGCFSSNAKVSMYDGTTKAISKINIGDIVLGYDSNNNLIPNRVTNTFVNGITESWIKLTLNNRQTSSQNIVCTANHKIYTLNRGYVEAQYLNLDDILLYTKKDINLTAQAKSILTGKILGDGYLSNNHGNFKVSFGHKLEHETYLDYCLDLLGNISKLTKDYRVSGYGSKMVRAETKSLICLTSEFTNWFNELGKKEIPHDIKLDKYSLAFWYMDDGSLNHTSLQQDRARLAVCAYSDTECERLIHALIQYGFVNPKLYRDSEGYNRIRLNTEDAYLLFNTIKDIIPDCMQYKLPEECRGYYVKPIIENTLNDFYSIKCNIKTIETVSSNDYPSKRSKNKLNKKHDIETETHNYFVSGCLVHNSNAAIVFNNDGSFYCQSRSRVIDPLNDNAGFAQWVHTNIDEIKSTLKIAPGWVVDSEFHNKNITVYGEWCGGNVQSGVILSQLPKMFIIFAIRYNMTNIKDWCGPDTTWQFGKLEKYINPLINLYNVDLFKQYELTIDFNNCHLIQNQIVEITTEVENECPIGKYFNLSGLGEGCVFNCYDSQIEPELYLWKSKGEKHSKSKVKTVGVVNVEAINDTKELANFLLYSSQLESRPAQAIRVLKEEGHAMNSNKDIKLFLDWIRDDIAKENMQDILRSGLKVSNVMSFCFTQAKEFYKDYLDKITFE